jgi:predicted DNA-binding protein (MmcQ/YjbR family)
MNKKLWNSVYLNGDVSDQLVFELIDHSYDLVVNSLTKKLQAELKQI